MQIQWIKNSESLSPFLQEKLTSKGFKEIQINLSDTKTIDTLLVSLPFKDDAEVKVVSDIVVETLVSQKYVLNRDDIVWLALNGPSVSDYMKSSAISAILIGLFLVAVYMMFSFASMRKHISPITLAIVVVATMFFDISIPSGAYALRMIVNPTVTVDTVFIMAILTTMWYSINDTIIVLDRVRENTIKHKDGLENGSVLYITIFESSIWQTMRRSIATWMATLLAIVAMYVFGASVMQSFAFTMGIGIIAGSFSSIFLGAPLAYVLLGRWSKEFKKVL